MDCKEQEAAVRCSECCDDYCRICFEMLHRRGARAEHTAVLLRAATKASQQDAHMPVDVMLSQPDAGAEAKAGWWFEERTKYIPMRLTMEERKYLRLLEAALQVSGYTDKIDGSAALAKAGAKRTQAQVREVCGFLTALVVAADYRAGKQLVDTHNFKAHEGFFQTVLEIGRRHKVMNPDKMRGEYGKLLYLLQV